MAWGQVPKHLDPPGPEAILGTQPRVSSHRSLLTSLDFSQSQFALSPLPVPPPLPRCRSPGLSGGRGRAVVSLRGAPARSLPLTLYQHVIHKTQNHTLQAKLRGQRWKVCGCTANQPAPTSPFRPQQPSTLAFAGPAFTELTLSPCWGLRHCPPPHGRKRGLLGIPPPPGSASIHT